MNILHKSLVDYANIVQQEIDLDQDNPWWWPYSPEHQIFEQAKMKFLNGNLNYFNFRNMIVQTQEETLYNKGFAKTLEFCNFVRSFNDDAHKDSPFGRMCVWWLPAKARLLPHKDNYFYHRFILRHIFVVSEPENMAIRINEKDVEVKKGLLFQFNPDTELHEFVNDSEKPFYFLGFDFWNNRLLDALSSLTNSEEVINDPLRTGTFGAGKTTKSKYISKH